MPSFFDQYVKPGVEVGAVVGRASTLTIVGLLLMNCYIRVSPGYCLSVSMLEFLIAAATPTLCEITGGAVGGAVGIVEATAEAAKKTAKAFAASSAVTATAEAVKDAANEIYHRIGM